MADLSATIETQEHRWMRAWMGRDAKTLKALTARDFILLTASRPPVILDTPSWLDAAGSRFVCKGYRFGDIYVRDYGKIALFATLVELEATLDRDDWSGRIWVTDLWRKGRIQRRWKMVERIMSRLDETPDMPSRIKSLQLWR